MALSIRKKMALGSVAFLIAVAALFLTVAVIFIDSARKSFLQDEKEQMASLAAIKKSELEIFFKERQNDMNVLIHTVKALRQTAFEKLQTVQQNKKARVQRYLNSCVTNIRVISRIKTVIDALQRFAVTFESEKADLNSSLFKYQHMIFGNTLSWIKEEYGFVDLYLIDDKGNIVYTVNQGTDIGQNLHEGDLSNSPLAKCYRSGLKNIAICDFEPYAPSGNQHAAFISAPVYSKDTVIGVVALQLSVTPINDILSMRDGMGKTGVTYLVGHNMGKAAFRCTLNHGGTGRFVLGKPVSADYVDQALAGNKIQGVFTNKSGRLIIVDADSLEFMGLKWACISEIELEEAIALHVKDESLDYFASYASQFGYYDLFLIHPEGEIFYSVKHEIDYGKNILGEEFKNTGLAEAVSKVRETGKYAVTDYSLYPPSRNEPAAFIASPLISEGRMELIVAVQLSTDFMNHIMGKGGQKGKTGITFLVGSDGLLRSQIPGSEGMTVKASMSRPDDRLFQTSTVKQALEGKTGAETIMGFDGRRKISAYDRVSIGDFYWALLAEIDEQEVMQDSAAVKNLLGKISGVGIIVLTVVCAVIIFMIYALNSTLFQLVLKPVKKVSDIAENLAQYNLAVTVESNRDDEMGRLFEVVNRMVENLRVIIAEVSETAVKVNGSAVQIAGDVSENAAITSEQSASISQISATMEEFSASSAQIAANSNSVVKIADATLESARSGADSVEIGMEKMEAINTDNQRNINEIMELKQRSDEIAKVMGIINNIADQTKLIAFNAALEASSAGEAGKRFSVVAAEIRRLADNVTASTEEIEKKITEIQSASNRMVVASEKSTKGISEGMALFTTMVDLLREILDKAQSTSDAAKQISLSTQQQKTATDQVAGALKDIVYGVKQTSASIQNIEGISEELKELSSNLQERMHRFKLSDQ